MRAGFLNGFFLAILVGIVLVSRTAPKVLAQGTEVGPGTESRFPPLKIPEGFAATLFACDPLVEYPSVIALGPRAGSLFVAHDYMTGLGVEIVRRDEVRLVEDSDGDGYADKSAVFAGGFNSIQGLAYYDNSVFVNARSATDFAARHRWRWSCGSAARSDRRAGPAAGRELQSIALREWSCRRARWLALLGARRSRL